MSIFTDIEYQYSQMEREKGESDEQLAKRLFEMQMEVYSANAMTTLYNEKLKFIKTLRDYTLNPLLRKNIVRSLWRHKVIYY